MCWVIWKVVCIILGHVIQKGVVQGCGEMLALWIKLPLAWGVPARGATPGEHYTTVQCHTAQV